MNTKHILLILIAISASAFGMEPTTDTESSEDEARLARGQALMEADFNEMMAEHLAEQKEEYRRIELNEFLIEAAINNDLQNASDLLESGADVHYVRNGGNPSNALQGAIEEGHIEMCALLIEAGADLNRMPDKTDPYPTALYYAKDKKMGEFLLANGADIRINATDRWSALLSAVTKDSCTDLCELYIKAGADLQFVNKWGVGPLKSAVIDGNISTAELLANKMLTVPNEEQKERMYALLGCLKRIAAGGFPLMYNKDIRRLIVRTAIKQENLPLVREQIGSFELEPELLQRLGI